MFRREPSADTALMDDGDNQHAIGLLVIENHMLAVFMTATACGKIIGPATHVWGVG